MKSTKQDNRKIAIYSHKSKFTDKCIVQIYYV